jgi:curved DNA-binding protein CbpA
MMLGNAAAVVSAAAAATGCGSQQRRQQLQRQRLQRQRPTAWLGGEVCRPQCRCFFGGRKLPDYYHVLQVTSASDDKKIKAAYLRRAKQLHPDVNNAPNAEARFKDLQEAYAVLSCPNERALYDQARGGGGANADGMMGGPQPTGMHVHPAYRRHVNYQRGGGFGGGARAAAGGAGAGADPWRPAKAKVERSLFGALEMAFSRTGALVTVAAGCALLVGLGLSTLSPKESNLSPAALAEARGHGMAQRFYPDLAVADFDYDREASEGAQLVRAHWHARRKKWIAADSWENLQRIGANRELFMVPLYKTQDDWRPPSKEYNGIESELAARRQRKAQRIERQIAQGLEPELTDAQKVDIVTARLRAREARREETGKARRARMRQQRKLEKKKKKKKKGGSEKKRWGLPPPK